MNDYLATPHLDGSLDVSDIPRKRLGLRYTAPDGSPRPFDLYYPPEGAGPFPLVVKEALIKVGKNQANRRRQRKRPIKDHIGG